MSKPPATSCPRVFTISADRPFAAALAQGILEQDGGDPAKMGRRLILLPTRRACRAVREAFLSLGGGKPLLLPRLQPLGDIDADELYLSAPGLDLDMPPAIPPLRRLMLLARLISGMEDGKLAVERHIPLARALCRLMDQVYTENLDLANLPNLVDGTEFASHWQITVDFLAILSEHWPKLLEAHGVMDAADRRNRLIGALADHWERTPPGYPVIAAGSTGSIPATAKLLGIISRMDSGAVILPGLDQIMDDSDWDALDDSHPQCTLRRLIAALSCDRHDIRQWPEGSKTKASARVRLSSEVMRPAASAEQWQSLAWPAADKEAALKGLHRIEADTAQEEADIIAGLLRETLETPQKTALVVTPDRTLAARIAAAMEKWGVTLDDSAGSPLVHSAAARFFLGVADMGANAVRPSLLLSVLKHPLCRIMPPGMVALLEKDLLRGLMPPPGMDGLTALYHSRYSSRGQSRSASGMETSQPTEALEAALARLNNILSPFITLLEVPEAPLADLLDAHLRVTEALSDADSLWQKEDGTALAGFLTQLREQAAGLPAVPPRDYPVLLRELMRDFTLRPAYGTHPRLSILGQIEARLIRADRLILAGLNEGTWPPAIGTDPFLSRPMKKEFGLPPPERSIGLAAHDFVQGFCADEVYLTRARKSDGAPALPARWLERLDTVLIALGLAPDAINRDDIGHWVGQYHHVPDKEVRPVARPAPRPAAALRPGRLSVTRIDTWLRDPYSIYARSVLGLSRLDMLEKEPKAAERGQLIHAVLERFIAETAAQGQLSPGSAQRFLAIAREEMPRYIPDMADHALIWPRLQRLADWFVAQENEWRRHARPALREIKGEWTIKPANRPFTLSGIADRIDQRDDGTAAIVDYKSGGGGLSVNGIKTAELMQLPLEALMMREGAFGLPPQKAGTLSYWVVTGGRVPGAVVTLDDETAIEAAVRAAEDALYELIRMFEKPETPYYALPVLSRAPRFNDYAHLSRIQEWTALDELAETA